MVEAAKSARLTCSDPATFNQTYWSGPLTPTGKLFPALADIWAHPAEYASGCQQNALLTELRGISLVSDVDRWHQRGNSVDKPTEWTKALAHYPARPVQDRNPNETRDVFIPGDWVHIANLDPATNKADLLQGENLIYVGGGKFWGSDGNKVQPMSWWKQHVAEWSNATMAGQPIDKRVGVDADIFYPKIGLKN